MVEDHYRFLIKKLNESLENRVCKMENKLYQEFDFLDNLKINFCKIEIEAKMLWNQLNTNNQQKLKKINSITIINEYVKHTSEENYITNGNKQFNKKGKIHTPIKKEAKKFPSSSIENQNSARKANLIKISLKNELKKINRNVSNFKGHLTDSFRNKFSGEVTKSVSIIRTPSIINNDNSVKKRSEDIKLSVNKSDMGSNFELVKKNMILKSKTLSERTKPSKYLKSSAPLHNILFKTKNEKALAIFTLSSYLNVKTRLYLNLYGKHLYYNFFKTKSLILHRSIYEYEKIIFYLYSKIQCYLEDEYLGEIIKKPIFIPSKTAQNGLNFLTPLEEKKLLNQKFSQDLINMFKLIFIMLNEDITQIEEENIIEILLTFVYKKYNVDNLKSLFYDHILKKINYSDEQIDFMNKIINEFPKVIQPTEIVKMNKTVSFVSFVIKEIVEFAVMKTNDGAYISLLRRFYQKYKHLLEKQQKLKDLVLN